jgi:hypothetical protein
VSGAAGNDIWAVGSQTSGDDFEALVEHWDGTSFTEVQAPTAPSEANDLYGVDGSGSTVWSVGAGYSPDKALTMSFPACP